MKTPSEWISLQAMPFFLWLWAEICTLTMRFQAVMNRTRRSIGRRGLMSRSTPRKARCAFEFDEPELLRGASAMLVTTDLLGKTYHAEMKFEHPDSTPYRLDYRLLREQETRCGCHTRSVRNHR